MSAAAPGPVPPDSLLDGAITFHQPETGYRAAIDPILLAAACTPKTQGRAVELGCGAGAASLALARRCPGTAIAAIDRDAAMLGYLRKNITANGLAPRITAIEADIRSVSTVQTGGQADLVLANPPFLEEGRFTQSENPSRRAANSEGDSPLADWVAAARRLSAPKAGLVIIHRADRLADLMAALTPAYGGIDIIPLWPKAGLAAKRVILRATLGSGAPMCLSPGLVLHKADGGYTSQAEAILRHGGPLSFTADD